jgi:uncharacterized membrane protein
LLVLDLPHLHGSRFAHDLGAQWHHYATYVVSFFTIGIIWVNHHFTFRDIERADRTLLFLNLVLLLFVSMIPWPTGLLADNLTGHQAHAAAALYSGVLLLMGVAYFGLNLYAARAGLHADHVPAGAVPRLVRRNAFGQFLYLVAVPVAFVSPALSLALCGAVALYYILPGRTVPT